MKRPPRAFTLVEVLLAIMLILAISAAMFGYLWSLSSRRDRLLASCDADAGAGVLVDQLESSLATTFVAGADGQAGVKGGPTSIQIRCRGVTGVGADLSDSGGVEFTFDANAGLSGRRAPSAEFQAVSSGYERIRFRYYDGREWLAEFDSVTAKSLPVAVEVAIWFGAAPPPAAEREPEESFEEALREPDRVRLIVVPDGPVTAWKGEG